MIFQRGVEMEKNFDIVVLGGGPGGYPAAIRAAQAGKSVAIVERDLLGGTCLNRGCIPTKVLVASGEALSTIRKAENLGLSVGGISFDYTKMSRRKDQIVTKLRTSLEQLIAANRITILQGHGRFRSPFEIEVRGERDYILRASSFIIATGSEPKAIPAFPFDEKYIHSSSSILQITRLPKSLLIIGGGVIGCEFASLYSLLEVEVTILEASEDILLHHEESIRLQLKKALEKRGVKVVSSAKIENISHCETGLIAAVGEKKYHADMALVAAGRSRNTGDIGLEKAGVVTTAEGEIVTDERMCTSVKHIFAVGDVTKNWWLAHVASHQGVVAASNSMGMEASMHYHSVPAVVFTDPEIGTVGLTSQEAKEQGYEIHIESFPFRFLGKSLATDDTEGFAQIICDQKSGQILGAQVIGRDAGVLIAEMAVAIASELTIECIADTIHAHPTLSESWLEASLAILGHPLHLPPRSKNAL